MTKLRYEFELVIGCTGGGFKHKTNHIKEVEDYVNEYRRDPINAIWLWDNKHHDYIFVKRALKYEPEVNLLGALKRDFRFKERHY